jgi:ribonuclease P protein component
LLLKNEYFRIYALAKPDPVPRLGLAVTVKLGKAVVRNRLKRHIREWFRAYKDKFSGFDLIVQPKPPAATLDHRELLKSLCELLAQLKPADD